jgi:hypothetical protein
MSRRIRKPSHGLPRNYWHCLATNFLGRFGDYVWADTKKDAELEFFRLHHVLPHQIKKVRPAW